MGAYQWTGPATIDFTSALLQLPERDLPQALAALLGHSGAKRCQQNHANPADENGDEGPAGLILCPCEEAGSRPPLRLSLGALEHPVPWTDLMQPVSGAP